MSLVFNDDGKMCRPQEPSLIPEAIMESLTAYFETGRPTGGFLEAVLTNDLTQAVARGDDQSRIALPAIVIYIYNNAPRNAWGSQEVVDRWMEQRLARRREEEREQSTEHDLDGVPGGETGSGVSGVEGDPSDGMGEEEEPDWSELPFDLEG